jgi:ADP-dependent NAD(P)H-hydrate dehydratase / NAD(P)H-hydrate epimerase
MDLIMSNEYWLKQQIGQPLYPDIAFNKPENATQAGKLLIIGGNNHAIATPSKAYQYALNQGIGEVRVVMPSSTKKLFGGHAPSDIIFTKSSLSGSFSALALDDLKTHLQWANGTLIAGDLSHNSETAILLEKLITLPGLMTFTNDSVAYLASQPRAILNREDSIIVGALADMQKIAKNSGFKTPLTSSMPLANYVEALHDFTKVHKPLIVTLYLDFIIVAYQGQVVTTKLNEVSDEWRSQIANSVAIWVLQQPQNPLKSAVTAISSLNLD